METIGIAAAIVTVVVILGWVVFQTFKTNNEDSAYNMHPSNFEKPDLESTIKFTDKDMKDGQTLDLTDLLDQKDRDKA